MHQEAAHQHHLQRRDKDLTTNLCNAGIITQKEDALGRTAGTSTPADAVEVIIRDTNAPHVWTVVPHPKGGPYDSYLS